MTRSTTIIAAELAKIGVTKTTNATGHRIVEFNEGRRYPFKCKSSEGIPWVADAEEIKRCFS